MALKGIGQKEEKKRKKECETCSVSVGVVDEAWMPLFVGRSGMSAQLLWRSPG